MERMLIGEADRAENLVTDRRDGTGSRGHRTRLGNQLGELLLHGRIAASGLPN
jgi:hypothetical protein